MEPYKKIAEHYKSCFQQHGDTPKGLDWDNQENMEKRYKVMFQLISQNHPPGTVTINGEIVNKYSILDFGCGYGGFYQWMKNFNKHIHYSGVDINEKIINQTREKYPKADWRFIDIHNPQHQDAFNNEGIFPKYDYIICNGTFTVKHVLTQKEMWSFMRETLKRLWEKCDKGIAFNCMSKILDYERDDLFHVSFDELGEFIYKELNCSKFTFRQDYGLREFTTYCYK